MLSFIIQARFFFVFTSIFNEKKDLHFDTLPDKPNLMEPTIRLFR